MKTIANLTRHQFTERTIALGDIAINTVAIILVSAFLVLPFLLMIARVS